MAEIRVDTASQSNPSDVATEHVAFVWNVDFEAKVLSGSATHRLKVKKDSVKEIILDTLDLTIGEILVDGKAVIYDLKPSLPVVGAALHIPLAADLKSGATVIVKIEYSCIGLTSTELQTDAGETIPVSLQPMSAYLCPIYGPASGYTDEQDQIFGYGNLHAPCAPLCAPCISTIRRPPHDGKVLGKDVVTYTYDQPIPIPSYLIAIAVGNIQYKPFSKPAGKQWTSGIWAEPELMESAFWEFSEDTTRFLAAEEAIVTDYKFGVYDLLVLPPSFPYGGMENACISFLTPTLLAGDRTLVDVVVHELTHSWFGNGVTHHNPSHFWLNEGWTTYIERVLQEKLHSPAHRGFSYVIGSKALYDSLKEYEKNPKYQRLVIAFDQGEDPDEAYSSIPYEKGSNFILYLERSLGGLDVFLPYVKSYVEKYMGQSITTGQWKAHLYEYWSNPSNPHAGADKVAILDKVDWDAWFFGEGTSLPVTMEYDLTLAEKAYNLAERWDKSRNESDVEKLGFSKDDLKDFNSAQIVVFLEKLQSYEPLPSPHTLYLGSVYELNGSPNAEIRLRFYSVALSDPECSAAKKLAVDAVKWVVGDDGTGIVKGRMKFCRPVLKAVAGVNRDLALAEWEKSKKAFHPIARKLIDRDMGLSVEQK